MIDNINLEYDYNGNLIRNKKGTYYNIQNKCTDKAVDYYGISDVWIYNNKNVVKISQRGEIGQLYPTSMATYLS